MTSVITKCYVPRLFLNVLHPLRNSHNKLLRLILLLWPFLQRQKGDTMNLCYLTKLIEPSEWWDTAGTDTATRGHKSHLEIQN